MLVRFGSARSALLCALALLGIASSDAHAHIKLLKPDSWIVEDDGGNPQKQGPCGSTTGTPTNKITTFTAGETIEVQWEETIYHPGHFRIAVVKDRSELVDPDVETDGFCTYPPGSISSTAVPPVLADNLFPRTPVLGTAESFTTMVKLPDEPCEKCTLQLIQFMTSHQEPCIYYHCADIKIVAASGNSGGAGGAGGAAGGQAGATGAAGAGTSGGAAGAASAGTSGMMMRPAPGGSAGSPAEGMTTQGGSGGTTGGVSAGPAGATAPVPMTDASASDDGGCAAGGSAGAQGVLSAALGVLLLGLRRRRIGR